MKKYIIISIISSVILYGCSVPPSTDIITDVNGNQIRVVKEPATQNDGIGDFPQVKILSEYPNTRFVSCLEAKRSTDKNCIYAATLLFAWNEIKTKINEPLSNFSSNELFTMDNSKSYKDVLNTNEYTVETIVNGKNISSKAYFSLSLPFDEPFTKYEDKGISFLNKEVEAFGFDGSDYKAKVYYYNNSNDFALKLMPEGDKHEIILVKTGFNDSIIFADELEKLNTKVDNYSENRTEENAWKYGFNEDDKVRIPILGFNIEYNYENIENSTFNSKTNYYTVTKAFQRNAFILNEKGAKVESYAEMEVEEGCMPPEEEPKFKHMYFDKSYIVFLKKKNKQYPYFAVFISNVELMNMISE